MGHVGRISSTRRRRRENDPHLRRGPSAAMVRLVSSMTAPRGTASARAGAESQSRVLGPVLVSHHDPKPEDVDGLMRPAGPQAAGQHHQPGRVSDGFIISEDITTRPPYALLGWSSPGWSTSAPGPVHPHLKSLNTNDASGSSAWSPPSRINAPHP